MINTIIFDLSEVLLTGLKGTDEKISSMLKMDKGRLSNILYGDTFNELMEGKLTETDFWNKIMMMSNVNVDADMLNTITRDNFKEIEGMRNLINLLRLNYKLGLLSNHAREWIEYCEDKFRYESLFEVNLYSYEVGLKKPNPKIFKLMLTRLGVKADNCLFIDDNEENVFMASKLGIKAIRFHTSKKLIEELKLLNIL
ncbi:MAG: hypothetical protein UR60_C0002G0012 [Candidatus Moranbacteria bacterium GW2011_GWF2_34_56]|nr:MAG: hypothetical protein UR51_C0009G0061 [Candidatus Moranbacteria bacterium GW2011_GWF1_34_10]KKP65360.1 MAG: hypothetical protein UR60_C0002G0012 [Candidatus Moranbacteria bacterium GW2011_GWF2_34_56]HBI17449.1 hypothetical protein [Candidatus Moranbacteria bacterium]